MKNQIIPALAFCLVIPWVVSLAFRTAPAGNPMESPSAFSFGPGKEALTIPPDQDRGSNPAINNFGLQNKQINLLIP